jgi:hypothetical protein
VIAKGWSSSLPSTVKQHWYTVRVSKRAGWIVECTSRSVTLLSKDAAKVERFRREEIDRILFRQMETGMQPKPFQQTWNHERLSGVQIRLTQVFAAVDASR